VHPQHQTAPGNGSNSFLEALQSQELGHLYSCLSAEGFEIQSMEDLRYLARKLLKGEFLAIMKYAGVTKITERVKLYELSSSDGASQPVDSSAGTAH